MLSRHTEHLRDMLVCFAMYMLEGFAFMHLSGHAV